MYTLSVITADDGSISASEPAPAEAICTVTTPDGCAVYMPGDEPPVFDAETNQGTE